MARNNEPAFRRKTPLLICSIRTEIPYPCIGSSANVFRMSISSVPWTRSLGLSGINLLPLGYQEENTLLLPVVKRRVMRGLDFRSQSERTFFGRGTRNVRRCVRGFLRRNGTKQCQVKRRVNYSKCKATIAGS